MAKLDVIRRALDSLQAGMLKQQPPLLVAKDESEVIGIVSMFPQLKAFTVSKDQFERSNMHKTWPGEVIFLNGKSSSEKTQEAQHEILSSLRESGREKLSVPLETHQEPRREEPKPPARQHSYNVQKKQILSKTSKKA
jgi:hypothetical protein